MIVSHCYDSESVRWHRNKTLIPETESLFLDGCQPWSGHQMSLKSWGHALSFDGEIKDLVPLKSGPLLTSLIGVIAILCILLGYQMQKHYTCGTCCSRER